jgi:hypothetical protein
MTDLILHGRTVNTFFDLLGNQENDITYSVGWALARSPAFCRMFLDAVLGQESAGEVSSIHLQKFGADRGFTDVEINAEHAHVIVEAKRGWDLPRVGQLPRYAPRLLANQNQSAIVAIAECTPEFVRGRLPDQVNGVPVHYLSWKKVAGLAKQARVAASPSEKRLLDELQAYLKGLMNMQDQESNLVFVVALGHGRPKWSALTWVEYVTERGYYFHPFGKGNWPRTPANYLGFRFDAQLQSIHHVENYEIVEDLPSKFVEIDSVAWHAEGFGSEILYKLGPAIRPDHIVKVGKKIIGNTHVSVAIDLLLTCDTISEANDLTKKRKLGGQ